MDLEDVARELYGLDLDDFVARRNALAKEVRRDGDRELAAHVAALRKPSIASWALNQLARAHGDDLTELYDLASALRDAQGSGDAAALRERSKDGQRTVRALVAAATEIAATRGRALAASAVAEVEQSLRDALGDEDVLAAIRNGALVDPPRSAGLGAFGIAAVGLTAETTAVDAVDATEPDDGARRRALDRAVARLDAARADRGRVEADLDALDHELADLDDERARLVEQLEALDARRATVDDRRRSAEERAARLAEEVAAAGREVAAHGEP